MPASSTHITVPAFQAHAGLVHGFSTRAGGVTTCYGRADDLNLGFTDADDPANVRANRTLLLRSIEAEDFPHFGLLRQRHTPDIHTLRSIEEAATTFKEPAQTNGDGLITNLPGILLTVQAADCVPVLLFDPVHRVVGAFHAGWRGTLAGIAALGAQRMHDEFGSATAGILAAIGPSIGPASYLVGEDLHQQFKARLAYADDLFESIEGEIHLNLWEANRQALLRAGIPDENISITGYDTAANTDRFFSHRAEHGFTGRMMGAIGLRAGSR